MAKSPIATCEQKALLGAFLSVAEWVKVYFLWRPIFPMKRTNT